MSATQMPDMAELSSLASRRLPMPDVSGMQSHCVRYAHSNHSVPGPWEASRSCGSSQQPLPSAMRLSLVEAPSEWTWPIRLGRCFRPGFKICLEIAHSSLLVLPISLQAHLLSEEESEQLLSWTPHSASTAPGVKSVSGIKGSSQGPTAALCGTVTRSAIVEAGKLNNAWSSSTPVQGNPTDPHGPSAPSSVDWPNPCLENGQVQRLLQLSHGLGLPSDSGLLVKGPPMQGQGGAVTVKRQSQPDQGSVGVVEPNGASWPPAQPMEGQARATEQSATMLSREEFVFSDLKFSKPSRMSPVYIAFSCTILATGDKLMVMYRQPTVCTCRAEQWAPACGRLGLPDALNTAPDAIPLGSSMPQPSDIPASYPPLTHAHGGWHTDASMVGQQAISQPLPQLPIPPAHHRVSDSGTTGFRLLGPQLPHTANPHMDPSTSSSNTPTTTSLQHLQQHQQQGALAAPVPIEAKDVMEWCAEAFSSVGLVRALSQEDLQALAHISNVPAAPTPQQACEAFDRFRINFQACLSFMRLVPSLWNRQNPYVVAGFAVNRELAGRRLAKEPVGTFLCRLSCSSSGGGMALAVRVAAGHPQAGPDNVLHVLITKADIEHKPIQTILRDYSGTTHLLDVYSGKRMDKRKVFASDYMRLGDIVQSRRRTDTPTRLGQTATAPSPGQPSTTTKNTSMDASSVSPSSSTDRRVSSDAADSSSASPPPPQAAAVGLMAPPPPPPRLQETAVPPPPQLAPLASQAARTPSQNLSHPDPLMSSTDHLMSSTAQLLHDCGMMTGGASVGGLSTGPMGGPQPSPGSQIIPSVSQMLLDSSQLDVAALLDSMAMQGNTLADIEQMQMVSGLNSRSQLFNTDEQMMAAALLGPD